MNAHRVEVLDRAYDYDVIRRVAHHLELEFLPALDRLLDQHLVIRRHLETPLDFGAILRGVACDRSTGAAERPRRTDDERQTQALADLIGFAMRMCNS